MVQKVLNKLRNYSRFSERIEHIEVLPPRNAIYGIVDDLPKNIQDYLDKSRIKLYEHQCESIQHIRAGKNVIITTPTASGKTLAFNIPILESLSIQPDATALYIYPAKALANDQLKSLMELEKEFRIDINPDIYDGDTKKAQKKWIRENSRIVLTNPYELHYILSWNHLWEKFYRNLKYVVIDEAHQYRGVFGSNVALLIRRFRRICNYYGSDPQFILSSATLANPREFGEKLTGLHFELIQKDGSPKGRKNFIFYNPYSNNGKSSAHQDTKNLFLYFINNDLQTLCFTISRKMSELIARWAKTEINETRPELTEKIMAYRAGYLAEDRRKIEKGLKDEDLIGVTSTNALELGINIGSLDAVIISGYPGTLISTWQQAGRAGRGMDDSIVALVAFENPLDQYFMKHPEVFFDKAHEHAIIDLENPYILSDHIMCASSEIPIKTGEIEKYFGDGNEVFLETQKKLGNIKKTDKGWIYSGKGNAAFNVGLNNISSSIFKVFYGKNLLETMDKQQAYREAHEGAVLINKGETYLVENFDFNKRFINVIKKDLSHHTQTMKQTEIKVLGILKNRNIGNIKISYGDLEVTEDYYKYKTMNHDKVISKHKLELPPIEFRTKGFWFTIPDKIKEDLESLFIKNEVSDGGLHGAEHAIIAMTPFHIMCDRFDLGGVSTSKHPDTGMATIFIYDAFSGGIGLSEKATDLFEEIIKRTYELVNDCKCTEGCPACIYSPKCGNDNKPLNKEGTLFILLNILKLMGIDIEKEHYTSKTTTLLDKDSELISENDLLIDSKEVIKLLNKGIYLEENENHLEAIKLYQTALKMEPDNPLIYYNKGISHMNLGEYEEAIKCAEKCIEIDSNDHDAWYLLGASFQYLEHYDKAISCYKIVLDIFPEHENAEDEINSLNEFKLKFEDNTDYKDEPNLYSQEYQIIIKTLHYHENGKKRANAAYKLGETKDPQYVKDLCLSLKDKDGNVRRLDFICIRKNRR